MPRTAVLLMDLQVDFLDTQKGRMPVGEEGTTRVIAAARSVLAGAVLPGAIPVAIVNAFPRSQRVRNWLRRNAAAVGTSGAEIDPRINLPASTRVFSKAEASAFSNTELHAFLLSQSVSHVWVIGVFAEGCVRATALGAKALGFSVAVPLEAIATNARWKLAFAKRSMQRHGVRVPSTFAEANNAT
ncbi:MAG: cysteine hydrolase family protein [Rhodoferax sp.]